MATFEPALAKTLKNEGGFYHDPKTGEVAYKGITLWLLRGLHWSGTNPQVKGTPATPEEVEIVKGLSDKDIAHLYSSQFWYQQQLNALSQDVAEKVFDLCVNTGNSQGGKLLQRAVNRLIWPEAIDEDGKIGPRTTNKANSVDQAVLLERIRQEAKVFYAKLVEQKPVLIGNLKGWYRRVDT
tara:strand:- start:746 stop:1291 length:546 start_codon:yes stop_codon:yes gene_type:complete